MSTRTLPLTDLALFKKKVLDLVPEASLPRNLSDHWLELLARDLEECVGEGEHVGDGSADYAKAPLALIFRLLWIKNAGKTVQLSDETLHQYFEYLRIEINLEIVGRATGKRAEAATFESILTNRMVSWPKYW